MKNLQKAKTKEQINQNMETSCKNVYVAHDASGWSRAMVNAAAAGLLVVYGIIEKEKR